MKKNYIWLLMLFVFSFSNAQVGTTCEDPIVIGSLPFSTTDNTANYADNYDPQTVTHPSCSTTASGNYYHGGNDVIYSYTPTTDTSVNFRIPGAIGWSGMFIYTDCANIGVQYAACSTSTSTGNREINDFVVTAGQTYYILLSTWPDPQTFAYTLNVTENTCTNSQATYTVVSDCANGPQFLVNVDITNLGTATSVTVSDNQGSAPQTASATGVLSFGPYPNSTGVIFTVQNDQDANCMLTSPSRTQTVCPPVNDTCATAIDLTNETSPLMSTTVGATNTNLFVCNYEGTLIANDYADVYYSIVVPSGSLLTIGQTVNNYDSANIVFYGDCDDRTVIACYDDSDTTQVAWANDTGSEQTVYWVQDGWSGTGTFTLAWSVIACMPAEATYTVVSDCANGEQFMVDVNVTNMGSATSITVSDDQGSAPQAVSATGIVTFGPYANATPVIFTVANDQDDNCTLTSPAKTQTVCPPVNDTCATAIDLANETSPLTSTTVGATNTNLFVCNYEGAQIANVYADVYYSIVVPAGSLLTIGQTENSYDSANIVFYGDCDNRNIIACYDDSDTTQVTWTNDTGSEQTVYWIQDGWSGAGTFTLAWSVIACTPAEATYTVVSDCANGEQFLVNVDVTNMGSATSITVSDDQGSAPQTVSATGAVTFGPYANATSVIFTVVNDQDDNCTLTSPARTQTVCPPVNDTCATAIDLANETSPLTSTTVGATNTNLFVCNYEGTQIANVYADVYYSIVVPDGSLLTIGQTENSYDSANIVFYGDCDNRNIIACYDDSDTTQVTWTNDTGSEQTVYWIQDGWSGAGTFTLAWSVIACTPAEATYTVVSDCANGEQFLVNVDVTNMGSATSITVSDDQGSAPQTVSATGIVTFGPYANATSVIFTVVNDQDNNCTLTSPARTQAACPPENDECTGAIALTVGAVFADFALETTNLAATRNPADHDPTIVTSTCDTNNFLTNGKDVWYTAVVPASGNLTIETGSNADENLTDTALYAYTGTCSDLTYEKCSGDIGYPNYFSRVSMTGLTPGEVVTARVWGYNGTAGSFKISAYDASLANVKFEDQAFKVYPNPVKDILNLSYSQSITDVQVFNMLGQQVLTKSVNATKGQVDMSNLSIGTYLVRINADNQVKTIKVIKQ